MTIRFRSLLAASAFSALIVPGVVFAQANQPGDTAPATPQHQKPMTQDPNTGIGAGPAGKPATTSERGSSAANSGTTMTNESDMSSPELNQQLSSVNLKGPLHAVKDDEKVTYSGPLRDIALSAEEFKDLSVMNGAEKVADIDGLLADDQGKVVALIADTEGFLNLNIGTKNVVLPLDQVTYDSQNKVFTTSKTKDGIKALPEWK
ncbi:PRC-barrel domain-containing protein [Rhodospirillum rubrum]|uniref:PRC-barrel domain-containing protein n=1 Tax=Rhodospirillum rubrum (strain ATCC 11170 / ATH 1.1.1 / DSM 467 / LMG 4362 / NCIMB 8255 / S1) TaxID=269796 RepID=Q2RSN4_RHORT|nr:PRC-barrel domain-containing protein [Rhodospirillum rubrum]ABC22861.1 hypothetical protein Rru_A2061 [Rhodospirillum rubrum ATCC 11170]MBK5954468.1 hypothetical protein [Rhodospirillum rubrum]QXG78849.1 PRC-barrel domain-containing protein [Rhodospirillum rubrum]HAP99612.1 hypothetical protein [Rhodospirillum rubrum]HCF16744.1 hypothetical protein [Rhodospirillum rubrum]